MTGFWTAELLGMKKVLMVLNLAAQLEILRDTNLVDK
jgi:hypothetical protein